MLISLIALLSLAQAVTSFYNYDCISISATTTLVNYSLSSLANIHNNFEIQYSYDKPALDPAYIFANSSGVRLSIYPTDLPFKQTSPTSPRTELRLKQQVPINKKYSYQIDQYIIKCASNYDFSFMQLFGTTGPNVLIRWKYGVYQMVTRNGNPKANVGVVPIIGKWVRWRVDFKLTNDSTGYINLYRDGTEIIKYSGPSYAGTSTIFKFGIYSQEIIPPQEAQILYKNLLITSH